MIFDNRRDFLSLSDEDELEVLKRHDRTGRHLGSEVFSRFVGRNPVQSPDHDSYVYCPRNSSGTPPGNSGPQVAFLQISLILTWKEVWKRC